MGQEEAGTNYSKKSVPARTATGFEVYSRGVLGDRRRPGLLDTRCTLRPPGCRLPHLWAARFSRQNPVEAPAKHSVRLSAVLRGAARATGQLLRVERPQIIYHDRERAKMRQKLGSAPTTHFYVVFCFVEHDPTRPMVVLVVFLVVFFGLFLFCFFQIKIK